MKIVVFALALLLPVSVFAQEPNLDHLMTRRLITCTDIYYNCQYLVQEYHRNGNDDSVRIVVNYWKQRCGFSEKVLRMETLLNIRQKRFSEEFYRGDLLDLLLSYRSAYESRDLRPRYLENDNLQWGFINSSFDQFTETYAAELSDKTTVNSLEYLICEFYSNNFQPLLTALKNNSLAGTKLQQSYNHRVYDLQNVSEAHMSLVAEYWVPMQKAKILGSHPGLGLQIGYKKKKFFGDLTLLFRFGDSKNYYQVYAQDSMFTTKHFFGGYIGGDVGYEIWRKKNSEFDLVGGIAYDVIDAVEKNEDANIDAVSLGSLNVNLGLGYRYYYKHGKYIGVQARFNAVNYATKGGTDLSGNTITFRLTWGVLSNFYRDSQLRYLSN